MRSKEAHVLESIANPALPTLQIVEYRGKTTENAPSVTSVTSAHPVRPLHSGRYTLRTIPLSAQSAHSALSAPAAPSAPPVPSAPTLRAAANGYGFEENTDASARGHTQTPQVAAALRNAPGLAKLHAVTDESADWLCLWYEPLDAGTLDKLLRAGTRNHDPGANPAPGARQPHKGGGGARRTQRRIYWPERRRSAQTPAT